jgi:DNA-binding cell septation regulator SpoVG
LRVVEGENGLFIGMPRQQGRNGYWYQTVSPIKKDILDKISQIVLEAYREE